MDRQRLAGLTLMAREAAATGQLKVTEEECRDLIWAMSDGHLWHQLVVERGWSDEQYADWLGRMWVSLLVKETLGLQSGPSLRVFGQLSGASEHSFVRTWRHERTFGHEAQGVATGCT